MQSFIHLYFIVIIIINKLFKQFQIYRNIAKKVQSYHFLHTHFPY